MAGRLRAGALRSGCGRGRGPWCRVLSAGQARARAATAVQRSDRVVVVHLGRGVRAVGSLGGIPVRFRPLWSVRRRRLGQRAPVGLGALPGGHLAVVLTTVSCSSAGNCGAGGYYGQPPAFDTRLQGVVVTERHGVWGQGDGGSGAGCPEHGAVRRRRPDVLPLGGQLHRDRELSGQAWRRPGVRGQREASTWGKADLLDTCRSSPAIVTRPPPHWQGLRNRTALPTRQRLTAGFSRLDSRSPVHGLARRLARRRTPSRDGPAAGHRRPASSPVQHADPMSSFSGTLIAAAAAARSRACHRIPPSALGSSALEVPSRSPRRRRPGKTGPVPPLFPGRSVMRRLGLLSLHHRDSPGHACMDGSTEEHRFDIVEKQHSRCHRLRGKVAV